VIRYKDCICSPDATARRRTVYAKKTLRCRKVEGRVEGMVEGRVKGKVKGKVEGRVEGGGRHVLLGGHRASHHSITDRRPYTPAPPPHPHAPNFLILIPKLLLHQSPRLVSPSQSASRLPDPARLAVISRTACGHAGHGPPVNHSPL
jgi:hypothetical protein